MKVTYIYADNPREQNCSTHNCIRPAESLNRSGKHEAKIMHINEFSKNSSQAQQFCNQADILVIERNFFGDALAAIMFWRVRNKPMVAIFDDAYHIITKDNPAYVFWHDNQISSLSDTIATRINHLFQITRNEDKLWANIPSKKRGETIAKISNILSETIPDQKIVKNLAVPAMDQFRFALKLMRGIQVPSKMLAEDWSKINEVKRINNYINPNAYIHAKPLYPKNDDKIVVGWHGSMSHVASFKQSGIAKALKIISQKYDNVIIYLGGDRKNFDLVDVPENRKRFHSYVSEQQWPSLLKTIDIAVAPLATKYDRRRSWIRAIEYMALKIPWIATNFEPYYDLKEYGTLTENGVENWVNSLSDMIENIDDYKEKAKGDPYEFALTQSYDLNMDKTIEYYEQLINKPYTW